MKHQFVTLSVSVSDGSLPPDVQATVDAWLRKAEAVLNAEAEQRMVNLLVYGCSHPESYGKDRPSWPPDLAVPA